jgi:hypothetical protein
MMRATEAPARMSKIQTVLADLAALCDGSNG